MNGFIAHDSNGIPAHRPRNTRIRHIPFVVIVSALILCLAGFVYFYLQTSSQISQNEDTISALRQDVAEYQSQILAYQSQVAAFQSQVSSLQEANRDYGTQVTSLQSDNASQKVQIESLQTDNTTYRNRVSSLENESQDLQAQLTKSTVELEKSTQELTLYKDTYGSVVASDISPRFERSILVNNAAATNPTWAQLQAFLQADQTDRKTYVLDVYDCKDFARDVHNNAEKKGIRSAWVAIGFVGEKIGHACNAFKTSDRGLVFIDCTGAPEPWDGLVSCDSRVDVKLGNEYQPVILFPDPHWKVTPVNMGIVEDVELYW